MFGALLKQVGYRSVYGDSREQLHSLQDNLSLRYFWKSCSPIYQENIQLLAKKIALRDLCNILVSAMLVNDEVIKEQVQEAVGSITEVSILSSWQDEADCRLVSHID